MQNDRLFNQLTITLMTAARVNVSLDWAGKGESIHSDPFSRLYLLNSGQGELIFDGKRVIMTPGHLYSIPGFTSCRYVCIKDMDLAYIHYVAEFSERISFFDCYESPVSLALGRGSYLADLFNGIAAPAEGEGHLLRCDGGIRLILAEFLARSKRRETFFSQMYRFEEVFSYINSHLTDTIRLDDLAGLVSLHPTYFSNLFTKTIGLSPVNYIQRKRVDRAALLLAFSNDTLETIARATGFSDAFHLSRVFKSFTGYAPGRFRSRLT